MGSISLQKLQTETENMLTNLGFLYSRYSFEDIVPYKDLRNKISRFDTDTSRILMHSPNYFIMPSQLRGSSSDRQEKAKKQIFFVRTLIGNTIAKTEHEIYKKYYKRENIIIIMANAGKLFIAKYSEIRTGISGNKIKLSFPKIEVYDFFVDMKLPVTSVMIKKVVDECSNGLFR